MTSRAFTKGAMERLYPGDYASGTTIRHAVPMQFYWHKINRTYPLIYSNNLQARYRKFFMDYEGRKPFDEDHSLPVDEKDLTLFNWHHHFTNFEKYINPQLLNAHAEFRGVDEYVGQTTGKYFPLNGWMKTAGTNRYDKSYKLAKRRIVSVAGRGLWQEKGTTPEWKKVPKLGPHGPQGRYEGKLEYQTVSLCKIIRACEVGRLNPNEVISLHALVQNGVVELNQIIWPGLKLELGGVEPPLHFPLHVELQRASPEVINAIEESGGTFVATYFSPEGIYQELHPDEFPTPLDQHLPDNSTFYQVSSNAKERGYLLKWYEEEAKYAHPRAGRRLSHYVSPPHSRDFPANFEEYERVKHHQKWHLNQPGSGTELPWVPYLTFDLSRAEEGTLE